jgi:hypothetical protein
MPERSAAADSNGKFISKDTPSGRCVTLFRRMLRRIKRKGSTQSIVVIEKFIFYFFQNVKPEMNIDIKMLSLGNSADSIVLLFLKKSSLSKFHIGMMLRL